MTRPPAIRRFEGLWLGSTLAWLAGAVLSLKVRQRMISASPELAGYEWLVPAGFALVLAVSLVLWWYAARRPQPIARIGVAVLAACSSLLLVFNLAMFANPRMLAIPANLLQLLSSALCVAGAAMLFGESARAWFGKPAAEVEA